MEIKDHIDKIFSSRLKEHSLAPPQSAWQAIEQRLDNGSPGKRGGRFFIPIIGLVVVLAIVGFFLMRDQSTTLNEGLSSSDYSISKSSENKDANNQQALSAELENISIQRDNSPNKNEAEAIALVSEPIQLSKTNLNKENLRSIVQTNSSGNNNTSGGLSYLNEDNGEQQQTQISLIEDSESMSIVNNGDYKTMKKLNKTDAIGSPIITNSLPKRTYKNSFTAAFIAQKKYNQKIVERPSFRLKPFKAKYSFRSQPGRYYLDMIFSTDFSIKTLKEREDRYTDFVDQRIDSERLFFAYMGALRVSRVFDRGFAIRSGVNYSQVTEIFNYEEYQSENHLRMIDVPIIAGWEFDYDNFGLTVNSGFIFNAYFAGKGMILNEDLEVVDIQNEEVFKNNIGASIYLSAGLNYDVSRSTQLIFEPYYKRMLGQVTKKEYPLLQRYTFVGLQFGLRHKF
jgi:hypothetical protein